MLALELARRGKTVRVFDRSSGPRPIDQSRALGILPPTLTLLEPSGVTATLIERGLKIRKANIQWKDTLCFTLDITKAGRSYPYILSLPQGDTERILIDALQQLGVSVEWNSEVVDLEDNDDGASLVVEHAGHRKVILASVAVGCDGVHSVVREKLGIAFEGDKLSTDFSLADVTLNEPDSKGIAVAIASPSGFVARLPLPHGTVRLISSQPGVEKTHGHLIKKTGWTSQFSIAFHHAEKFQKGRFFLAGDAAHVHSPAGGRGMNTGIGDAAWLAYLVCEGRAEEYESYRLPIAKKIIEQTRTLTRVASKDSLLRQMTIRWILPVLLKLNWFQKRAARQLLAYDMPYPEWIDRGRY